MGHETKCASLHGHNGVVEIFACPIGDLDLCGRVIDFAVLKEKVGGWIDENWDHTMILNINDKETVALVMQVSGSKKPYLLDGNPTAENLARHLLMDICPKLLEGSGVRINKVVFWETANCCAEVVLSEEKM